MDADYADYIALLADTPTQADSLQNNLNQASISLHVNAENTEQMGFNQKGALSSFNGDPLKLVDGFMYLGISISSSKPDVICA